MSKQSLIDSEQLSPDGDSMFIDSQLNEQPKYNHPKAFIYANAYSIISAIFLTGVKLLQQNGVRYLDLAFVRFIEAAVIAFIVLKCCGKGIFSDIQDRYDVRDILLRSLAGFIGFNIYIYVTNLIPLFILNLIFSMTGFWASIQGYFLFNDRLSFSEIFSMFIGYFGLALIIIGGLSEGQFDSEGNSTFLLGMGLALINSILASLVMTFTRKMRKIHFSVIQFHYGVFGTVLMAVIWYTDIIINNPFVETTYSVEQKIFLFLVSSLNGIYMLVYTGAMQIEKAGVITIIAYGQIILTLIADIFIFGYQIKLLQILGGSLIVSVNIFIVISKLN